MDYWSIPKLWPDSTVFIIGGGPSLLQQDLSLIHDQRVIGVNQAYKLGSWVDICWYGDKNWYHLNMPQIKKYGGLIVTCSIEIQINRRISRVFYVGRSRKKMSGIEYKDRTQVCWNHNSGASAINLAYWLGAKTIVLLGFDMQLPKDKKNGSTHWHDDYERKINRRTGFLYDPYERYMKDWPYIAKDAKEIGLKIINATPGGALNLFERKTIEQVMSEM